MRDDELARWNRKKVDYLFTKMMETGTTPLFLIAEAPDETVSACHIFAAHGYPGELDVVSILRQLIAVLEQGQTSRVDRDTIIYERRKEGGNGE